jgi:GTP:adenosylcobinamide-phosphate guanylyltransferase
MADAFVLAAGEDHGRLSQLGGTRFRALIEVAGKSMVERVLAALRAARRTNRIAVVAPSAVLDSLPRNLVDVSVVSGSTLVENVMRGVAALADGELILFAHADAPLVSPAAIDDFLERAEPMNPDLAYAIVSREAVEKRFPRSHRTYARLREGSFTGTNIVLVKPQFLMRRQDLIRDFYQHRKSPVRLAGMLGAGFVLRLLSGTLTLAHLERRIGQVVGGEARAIVSEHAELAFDVDKPEDLEIIRQSVGQ